MTPEITLYWAFQVPVVIFVQVHLYDQDDIPNVRDMGIAAAPAFHTSLDIVKIQVSTANTSSYHILCLYVGKVASSLSCPYEPK